MSIQDIRQNPQDTSNFYLSNIYQTLADPNGSNTSTSPPPSPPPFSPPNHAVWVNALWFLSLVISLTCALLATLLQQWARRYLKITQSRHSPHKRARIRAFFSEGVEKCLLLWAVDALPSLLHISLFLFFAGLVVFLSNVDLTIFKLVLSWVSLCAALYGCLTCMPIIRHDSPYYTPLSLLVWQVVNGIPYLVYRFLQASPWSHYDARLRFRNIQESYRKSLMRGMQKTAEEAALSSPSDIGTRSFMWTFDCLDEDHELEDFFSNLPSFRSSHVVNDPFPSLTEDEKWRLSEGLRGLLDRTFSSDLLAATVKNYRAMKCAKAIDPEHMLNAFVLHATLFKYQRSGLVAITIANILRKCENNMNRNDIWDAQLNISLIIANRQSFDDSWYILASSVLGFPEASLRDHAAQGDSLSLLILIHFVCLQFTHFRNSYWPTHRFSLYVLSEASIFNVQDTSLKLQHEFCALWNQIVNKVQGDNGRRMAHFILRDIHNVFLALHKDTDSAPTQFSASASYSFREPSSYTVCKVPHHHSDSTPHIHDDDVSTTLLARTIPYDLTVPPFVPSLTRPDQPSSPPQAPSPIDETLTDALPLDSRTSVLVSTQVIGRTSTEGRCVPTSSSQVTTRAIRRNTYPRTTRPPTSSPLKSKALATPPAGIAVALTELSRTPSGDLNVSSSPSPSTPVLDAIPPTGALLFQVATRSELAFSSPACQSSILASAAEGEGITKAGLSMEEDSSYSPLAVREDITATADIPPQLPSPSPVADLVIDDPSGTEHTEHRPIDPAHSQYDIVSH